MHFSLSLVILFKDLFDYEGEKTCRTQSKDKADLLFRSKSWHKRIEDFPELEGLSIDISQEWTFTK